MTGIALLLMTCVLGAGVWLARRYIVDALGSLRALLVQARADLDQQRAQLERLQDAVTALARLSAQGAASLAQKGSDGPPRRLSESLKDAGPPGATRHDPWTPKPPGRDQAIVDSIASPDTSTRQDPAWRESVLRAVEGAAAGRVNFPPDVPGVRCLAVDVDQAGIGAEVGRATEYRIRGSSRQEPYFFVFEEDPPRDPRSLLVPNPALSLPTADAILTHRPSDMTVRFALVQRAGPDEWTLWPAGNAP